MKVCTAPADQRWPNGEVPYQVPGLWAANDALLRSVSQTVAFLNCALRGHVTIRSRQPGDRDYLELRATTLTPPANEGSLGRQGGRQGLHCQLRSLNGDAAAVPAVLVRELCRAAGVNAGAGSLGRCISPHVIDELKQLYPEQH